MHGSMQGNFLEPSMEGSRCNPCVLVERKKSFCTRVFRKRGCLLTVQQYPLDDILPMQLRGGMQLGTLARLFADLGEDSQSQVHTGYPWV